MKQNRKDGKITVRLTPHQDFMISEITKDLKISKSVFIRYIINGAINKYNEQLEQLQEKAK